MLTNKIVLNSISYVYYRSKHKEYGYNVIKFVELKKENSVKIISKNNPEHKIRNKPYTDIIAVKIDDEIEEIKESVCQDCAAATGNI